MATKLEKAVTREIEFNGQSVYVSLDPEGGFTFRTRGSGRVFGSTFAEAFQLAHDAAEKEDAAFLRSKKLAVKKAAAKAEEEAPEEEAPAE